MTRQYKVADHLFELTYRDDCPLWNELGNYEPFEVKEKDGKPLFSVTIVDELAASDKTPLLVGCVEPGMPRLDLFAEGNGYWIEMAPLEQSPACGFLRMSPDCSKAELKISESGKFCVDNALMLIYTFSTSCMQTLEMHSSVVMHEGKGFMFLGKSGAGKSTHSRMWMENIPGCVLLNDDNPIIRISANGEVRVYGSPWSGKTRCYKNISAPVAGLASIVQAPGNAIKKLSPVEAYVILSASVSGFRADKKMSDGLFETMEKLISSVGFYELQCLPDAEAAELCKETLSK